MPSLMGTPGELAFTVQITRAATGQVEEYQLVGRITAEQAEQLGIETDNPTESKED